MVKQSVLILALVVTSIQASAASAEKNTIGKLRVIEVPPEPVYQKKSGKFVSEIGRLEITTPECFALWPEGEEEGYDPAYTNSLAAERDSECKPPVGSLRYIFLLAHDIKPRKILFCGATQGGYFAHSMMKIAGRDACLATRIKGGWPENPGDVWREFETSCPTTTIHLTFLRHETDATIDELKRTKKANVPAEIQKILDTVHCLPEKKK